MLKQQRAQLFMVLIQEFEFRDLSIGVYLVFYAFSEYFLRGNPLWKRVCQQQNQSI